MKEIVSKQLHLLNTYPELIYKGDNALNGYVVYQTGENNELHVYNPNECFLNAYNEYKEEAKSVYYKNQVNEQLTPQNKAFPRIS